MTPEQLTSKLRNMHQNAPKGEKTTMIHLFGILYANELKDVSVARLRQIAEEGTGQSGVADSGKASYATEIRKTVKLSHYVELKSCFQDRFK